MLNHQPQPDSNAVHQPEVALLQIPEVDLPIEEDPTAPSYPQSAGRFLLYRIAVIGLAIGLIIVGKSNLPSDAVPCLIDVVIDWFQPLTNYYIQHEKFGLALISIAQLIVDIELIAMLAFWFFKGNSLRYPILLGILGISKILLNVLFMIKPIDNAFTKMAFPSFTFGQNFANTYFFSGICTLLMFILLQLFTLKLYKLFAAQIVVIVYIVFILLTMRLNFFMDVATAFVFAHYVFYFINERIDKIDAFIFMIYDKITGSMPPEEKDRQVEIQLETIPKPN